MYCLGDNVLTSRLTAKITFVNIHVKAGLADGIITLVTEWPMGIGALLFGGLHLSAEPIILFLYLNQFILLFKTAFKPVKKRGESGPLVQVFLKHIQESGIWNYTTIIIFQFFHIFSKVF